MPIFLILCHLLHDRRLRRVIVSLGVHIILLHLHHLLLLGILLLHYIRVLIGIIGILVHHLARILNILLLRILHIVDVLRELELSSCITRGKWLNRRYSIVHRREQRRSKHCSVVVLLSTWFHLTDSANSPRHSVVHWRHHLVRISINQLLLLIINLIVAHLLRVLKLLVMR
jgi:hypothetical protein